MMNLSKARKRLRTSVSRQLHRLTVALEDEVPAAENQDAAVDCYLAKPVTQSTVNRMVDELTKYLSLADYDIVWNDGERSIPEIWQLVPNRRFTYFALLSLYDFAVPFCQGMKVLDFGSGVGAGSYYLASRGAERVVGIEIDDKSYRYARDRYKHERLDFLDQPVEALADTEHAGTFDFVLCSNVMEHIADYDAALDAVYRLLKPGGQYFQVTPPSGKARGNKYHVTNFTVPQWLPKLEPRFEAFECFAHVPQRDRLHTNNEFDFHFEPCGPAEMSARGSISGMVLCKRTD